MSLKRLLTALVFTGLVQLAYADQSLTVSSPDNNIQLLVTHQSSGGLQYSVTYKGKPVVLSSSVA